MHDCVVGNPRLISSTTYRDHLLIEGNPCTKFGIDQVKGSKDIEQTTLGLQTDQPTYRLTVAKQHAPFFKGGIKIIQVHYFKFKFIFSIPLYAYHIILVNKIIHISCVYINSTKKTSH